MSHLAITTGLSQAPPEVGLVRVGWVDTQRGRRQESRPRNVWHYGCTPGSSHHSLCVAGVTTSGADSHLLLPTGTRLAHARTSSGRKGTHIARQAHGCSARREGSNGAIQALTRRAEGIRARRAGATLHAGCHVGEAACRAWHARCGSVAVGAHGAPLA